MATNSTTAKAPNYTPEQEARISALYSAAETDEARKEAVQKLAEELGKNARSIIAKLTNMKLYKRAGYVRKDGEPVKKKDEQADFIGKVLRLSEADTDSLTKANRKALAVISAALANSQPVEILSDDENRTKGERVAAIATALEMSEDEAEALARCGAAALAVLYAAIVPE